MEFVCVWYMRHVSCVMSGSFYTHLHRDVLCKTPYILFWHIIFSWQIARTIYYWIYFPAGIYHRTGGFRKRHHESILEKNNIYYLFFSCPGISSNIPASHEVTNNEDVWVFHISPPHNREALLFYHGARSRKTVSWKRVLTYLLPASSFVKFLKRN